MRAPLVVALFLAALGGAVTDSAIARGSAASGAAPAGTLAARAASTTVAPPTQRAEFGDAHPSRIAREVADWALASADPSGLPFLIVDKPAATLYVFDANGRLVGFSPVLLGLARGDDSVPGIGTRPMAQIRPDERTTPAGRFLAERGVNSHGEDVVWVDYDAAVSMHRVRATNPKERRLERLRTPTIADNRISYGCINVPARFYDRSVVPAFSNGHAVVYVLPETRPVQEQFGFGVASARAPSKGS
ncbi:MAG: L,D-transpeptidase [Burkholderiaceae bacterium]|nr:L,D-transpeptidase [Burkholderiaceae bacterium]